MRLALLTEIVEEENGSHIKDAQQNSSDDEFGCVFDELSAKTELTH